MSGEKKQGIVKHRDNLDAVEMENWPLQNIVDQIRDSQMDLAPRDEDHRGENYLPDLLDLCKVKISKRGPVYREGECVSVVLNAQLLIKLAHLWRHLDAHHIVVTVKERFPARFAAYDLAGNLLGAAKVAPRTHPSTKDGVAPEFKDFLEEATENEEHEEEAT